MIGRGRDQRTLTSKSSFFSAAWAAPSRSSYSVVRLKMMGSISAAEGENVMASSSVAIA